MKRLTALAAFLLVLLPTHLPWWLDTARPVGGDAAGGSGGPGHGRPERHAGLGAARASCRRPAVRAARRGGRPVHDLARISVGRPFGVALGPDGLMRAFTYGIDELRTLRVVRARRRAPGRRPRPPVRDAHRDRRRARSSRASSARSRPPARRTSSPSTSRTSTPGTWTSTPRSSAATRSAWRSRSSRSTARSRATGGSSPPSSSGASGSCGPSATRARAGAGYYDAEGRPLRKAFLRSPLRFTRISSRFSRSRLHPVLHVRRRPPRRRLRGARRGRPVAAAADGVVSAAGWMGGLRPDGEDPPRERLRDALRPPLADRRAAPASAWRRATRIGAVGAIGPRDRAPPRLPDEPQRPVRGPAAPRVRRRPSPCPRTSDAAFDGDAPPIGRAPRRPARAAPRSR